MNRKIFKWIGTYINILSYIAPRYAGKFGFKMFGRPISKKIKPSECRFLNTSKRFSFFHKKTKIQGYKWGNGSKRILLLHGWQSHSGRWEQLVETLHDNDFTIYAFDAPGHGLSQGNFFSAPLYGEIILQFGNQVGRFHTIVGHSLGAFSVLYALSHFNQLETDRLIVMASPGEVKDFVTHFKQKLELNEKSLEQIKNQFKTETGMSYDSFSISNFASRLDVPGLIIHDKNDRFAPFKYAKILNQKWEQSNFIATEGMGHHLSSSAVVDMINDYVNTNSSLQHQEMK